MCDYTGQQCYMLRMSLVLFSLFCSFLFSVFVIRLYLKLQLQYNDAKTFANIFYFEIEVFTLREDLDITHKHQKMVTEKNTKKWLLKNG